MIKLLTLLSPNPKNANDIGGQLVPRKDKILICSIACFTIPRSFRVTADQNVKIEADDATIRRVETFPAPWASIRPEMPRESHNTPNRVSPC